MTQEASCCCGKLKLTYEGEITKTSMCHCFQCQMRTGSVFGVQSRLLKSKAKINGQSTKFERVGDEGGVITFHFCPTCGSTVFWEYDDVPDALIVAIGSFTNPNLPAPTFSVYKVRKHHWVEIPRTVTEDWD
jgi:hypothetical protein